MTARKRIYAENGGFNVIVFTAPEDGTYSYEFSGHNAWGNDIELAVNINGNSSTWGKSVNGAFGSTGKASDTVNLKKGEKIFFVPRLTAGADQAGQHDYFVLESFSVSTVKYVEKQPVNPGTGTYIAASGPLPAQPLQLSAPLRQRKRNPYNPRKITL